MKALPRDLVASHYATLRNEKSGKWNRADYAVTLAIPAASAIASFACDLKLGEGAINGLIAVAGIFGAFLFGAMLQVAQRALEWADTAPKRSPETSRHARYLKEIVANAGYASLVCVALVVVFLAVTFVSGDLALRLLTALGIGMFVHVLAVLLIVSSRVYLVTVERLRKARTGELRASEVTPPTRRHRSRVTR
jgi:hypothetical protein